MVTVTQEGLSKFEKTRILSARALQIAENAPIYIDPNGYVHYFELAEAEFKAGKTPLKVARRSMKEDQVIIEKEVK